MSSPGSLVVMKKEVRRAAKMQRQQQHDEKIQRIKKILSDAGYNCGWGMSSRRADMEFFLGAGSAVVIALCNQKDINSIDIFVPLNYLSRSDGTLDALRNEVYRSRTRSPDG
jgi:hypothetical protein